VHATYAHAYRTLLPRKLLDGATGSFTIEFFIRNPIPTSTVRKTIVELSTARQVYSIYFSNGTENMIETWALFNGTLTRTAYPRKDFLGGTTNTSRWNHVAFVYAGSNANNYLYINGKYYTNSTSTSGSASFTYYGGNQNMANIAGDLNIWVLPTLFADAGAPIYNLRLTRGAVYTSGANNFVAPTTELSSTFPADSGLECIFCLESYLQNNTTYIRDKVTGNNYTPYLGLNTTVTRF